jgi:hypothetical protein
MFIIAFYVFGRPGPGCHPTFYNSHYTHQLSLVNYFLSKNDKFFSQNEIDDYSAHRGGGRIVGGKGFPLSNLFTLQQSKKVGKSGAEPFGESRVSKSFAE